MSVVAPVAPLDSMTPPSPSSSSPSFSKTSGNLFGKTKAFCQEEEEEEEVVLVAEEEVKVGSPQKNSVFSTSSSDPPFVIACDSLMRGTPHSGSSSLSSSPSCDEEDEKDDGNDYSALVKRFFIDEHASFRPAGAASQLDGKVLFNFGEEMDDKMGVGKYFEQDQNVEEEEEETPSHLRSPYLSPPSSLPPSPLYGSSTPFLARFPLLAEAPPVMSQDDSFETRFGSLKFELEKELQSVHTDDSFEGLVKRFKIDPYSSNMRSPFPSTCGPSMAQPSPFPGFSPFGRLDLSSLRARSSSISRSRSRSLSRSRAGDDHLSSTSSATAFSLNPVLHKRVRSGRISRSSRKQHPQQHQRQQQPRRREKGAATSITTVLPGKRQFPARRQAKAASLSVPKGASRVLFPSNPAAQQQPQHKKKQSKKPRDSRPLSPPLIEIAPRPRKLELLQSTQRLMSLYRPAVSSVW